MKVLSQACMEWWLGNEGEEDEYFDVDLVRRFHKTLFDRTDPHSIEFLSRDGMIRCSTWEHHYFTKLRSDAENWHG